MEKDYIAILIDHLNEQRLSYANSEYLIHQKREQLAFKTLAAALAFLPDMPDTPVFCISSPSMAQACAELAEASAADAPAAYPLPEGMRALCVNAAALASLCGRSQAERLARALRTDQLERLIILLLPA